MKKTESNDMKKIYEKYYKCATCDSTYHVSMLFNRQHECKDCGNISEIPQDAQEKARLSRKY